ncbi:PEP-CTERM sorting domain-containing protein [Roseateles terrae]|uniref:Ice-binding protein C-terminal domain-containing protein n=1 Tax=Roseateles terrae TaxID=431060 RepID=A0ABR6GM90_9BURK|nr:PEP-CTERM sorting domain-containing protein [Roseateles terrae]MBB3193165.1 hypothetical protein [Roseateles terrae]OWQ89614.1 hypothetical protein CDN98_03570 [Roseateles terrae]
MTHMFSRGALAATATALMTLGLSTPAVAALTGDYDNSHWTTINTHGGNGSILAMPDTVTMTSSDFSLIDATPVESWLSYGLTVTRDTQLAFDWHYETQDMSSSFDVFGYTLNGVFTPLSQEGLSFLETQGGRQSLNLIAGSSFAWSLRSVDSEGGSAIVHLSGLSAQEVTAVPEPTTCALMIAGLGLVVGVTRRRPRRTHN